MRNTSLLLLVAILLASCSSNRRTIRTAEKLDAMLIGSWKINRKKINPGNTFVRDRGLERGSITFYPNNTFMYQNKYGRYTGDWQVSINTMPAMWGYTQYSSYTIPPYAASSLNLSFNTSSKNGSHNDIVLQMIYGKSKKIKFEQGDDMVNIFTR